MKQKKKIFTCEKCGGTWEGSHTRLSLCVTCRKKRWREENTESMNPYGHRVRSTPAASRQQIGANNRVSNNGDDGGLWCERHFQSYTPYGRHHPIYRQAVETHNDLVRRYYQRRI